MSSGDFKSQQNGVRLPSATFEGSCNRNLLETWLLLRLIPQLEPGDIIILDNASFHQGERIREILEESYTRCREDILSTILYINYYCTFNILNYWTYFYSRLTDVIRDRVETKKPKKKTALLW